MRRRRRWSEYVREQGGLLVVGTSLQVRAVGPVCSGVCALGGGVRRSSGRERGGCRGGLVGVGTSLQVRAVGLSDVLWAAVCAVVCALCVRWCAQRYVRSVCGGVRRSSGHEGGAAEGGWWGWDLAAGAGGGTQWRAPGAGVCRGVCSNVCALCAVVCTALRALFVRWCVQEQWA